MTQCQPVAPAAPEMNRAELRRFFASHPLNNLVVISNHAVDRYRKRFRVVLEIEAARRELYAAMRARGQFTPIPPQWLFQVASGKQLRKANVGYMVIDDELAMPLRPNTPRQASPDKEQPYIAVTCLYRLSV